MKNRTTIFKQLILNIIIPVVMALVILGLLNYYHTKSILVNATNEKNLIISEEIQNIMQFQDYSLDLIEADLNVEMERFSQKLAYDYFADTDSIENADLNKIRMELGMDPILQDLYIINKNGIVVNTTFKKDLGLNFFSFGEQHKKHLIDILQGDRFVSERFSIETNTKKLKKYTYQPTKDHQYIIEIGVYSNEATKLIEAFKDKLNSIAEKHENIVSVEMFIGADNPISFNSEAQINDETRKILKLTFDDKSEHATEVEDKNGNPLHYQYIYMDRQNTDLYKGAVIRIVSDKSGERKLLRNALLQLLAIFGITIFTVIFLIYNKTRVITNPIKKLVENVNTITEGNLSERADVIGNNEITRLSEQFNLMVENLEESYNSLERKVKERTEEILQQKDALAEQKKQIMDSILYARRIQNAILPPKDYINEIIPNNFFLYKPKDIVSGDFYWVAQKDDHVLFAAVDCTGHGVPGAFMSIVGHNELNNAIALKQCETTADVLNFLNKGVTGTLNQSRSAAKVRDGMDIALCAIDYKNQTLQFSGAFNPLYLVRNGELIEVKGDKFPIGAFMEDELVEFTNHKIELQKGDTIYIFSDGFADQFGGPRGKKFKYKNFKQLLLEIQELSLQEQKKTLDNTITEWMGSLEQIDDILIIGVRI